MSFHCGINLTISLKSIHFVLFILCFILNFRYDKIYTSVEKTLERFQVYKHNLKQAQLWQDNEQETAVYGETKFMDLTSDEFKKVQLC